MSCCGGPFLWGPLFGRTCWTCLNPPLAGPNTSGDGGNCLHLKLGQISTCRGKWPSNKHNYVLSNAGLSNALTKSGICASLKSGFYFRFHSPSKTKSALPNFINTRNLVLICWKVCSPEPENCRNQNPHTSKISKLLRRCDDIPESLAKFGKNL